MMAKLNEKDRKSLWSAFMSDASRERSMISLSKSELRSGVNAIDDWIDDNIAAFNAAMPQAIRDNLSAKQKLRLFVAVAERRWEVS